ncbi:beta-mannanase [Paeniglutamicibacter antarcticus]|uniref:Beta-mannanase n=1 Tax=Arthrobacter terrae TaxID=2935737 RepID=A0A931G4F4_9MICC|nr:glycosyl hydrolase [Arthrobacter terrae]MBG0739661.1 beta-mannanase [Arthrobacter terrae]
MNMIDPTSGDKASESRPAPVRTRKARSLGQIPALRPGRISAGVLSAAIVLALVCLGLTVLTRDGGAGRDSVTDSGWNYAGTPPISNKKLKFGITTHNGAGDADAVAQSVGEYPAMIQTYVDFSRSFDVANIRATIDHGAVPIVTWEPWLAGKGVNQPGFRLATIIDGSHDAYISSVADQLVAAGDPKLSIRLAHEMNGYWYPWSEQENSNQPGEYVRAWRHIVELFRATGLRNVNWIWSPNAPSGRTQDLAGLYPGSRYVGQVGLDAYNFGSRGSIKTWTPVDQLFGDGLDELARVAPGKPIIIAETASVESAGSDSKAEWIRDMVAYLDSWRSSKDGRIYGFLWFNYRKFEGPVNRTVDWRFNSTPADLQAMRDALRKRQ